MNSEKRGTDVNRKITCAHKHFEKLGISYRVVTDKTPNYWQEDDTLDANLFNQGASDT